MTPAPSAIVLGVGGAAGVSAIRRLARHGVSVYAVDHLRSPLGFHSRHATPRRVPDPRRDGRGFEDAMCALADDLGGRIPIFPARDEDLNAVAERRTRLGERFLYPFPQWELLGRIQEKRFQVQRARETGISIPTTADTPEDVRRYPVLVKPSRPAGFRERFGTQAIRCDRPEELERAFAAARGFDPLIQEVIPGSDRMLFSLGAYIASSGAALGVFCGRKLRQSPAGVGTCRIGEALWIDSIVEQGIRFLRELSFTGIAQVEFKYDMRDRTFKFIEVNPRLWQWHENAAACGVDLPWIAYQDLTGKKVSPTASRGCRRRWALTFYDSLAPALAHPPYVDPFLPPDDPRLAIAHLARVARRSLGRARA